MRLIHLADLHIGKRLKEFSFLDEQRYILDQVLSKVRELQPDGIILAGDIFDKAIPSEEALQLLEDFLKELAAAKLQILMVAGNHDSVKRLSFGSSFMQYAGVHIASHYQGRAEMVSLQDAAGLRVNCYLLPHLKPSTVRDYLPEEEQSSITNTETAVAKAIDLMEIDKSQLNLLIAHQTVGGFEAGQAGSEDNTFSIGGSDNVSPEILQDFDYVALGHLHNPQQVGEFAHIRYAGTPLIYSFSSHERPKSMTIIDLRGKGDISITTVPLVPRLRVISREISYQELMQESFYKAEGFNPQDIFHFILTDKDYIANAYLELRSIYPNMLEMSYKRDSSLAADAAGIVLTEGKTVLELLEEFYKQVHQQEFDQEQKAYLKDILEEMEAQD